MATGWAGSGHSPGGHHRYCYYYFARNPSAFSVPVTKSYGVSGGKSFSVPQAPCGENRAAEVRFRALAGLRVRGGAGFQRLWLLPVRSLGRCSKPGGSSPYVTPRAGRMTCSVSESGRSSRDHEFRDEQGLAVRSWANVSAWELV